MFMGTSQMVRVLDDGSLLFISMPLEGGQPKVVGKDGPEEVLSWGVRLGKIDGRWKIVGVNDVGDRQRIDWIRL